MNDDMDVLIKRDGAGWLWELKTSFGEAPSHERFGQASEAIAAASRFLALCEVRRGKAVKP